MIAGSRKLRTCDDNLRVQLAATKPAEVQRITLKQWHVGQPSQSTPTHAASPDAHDGIDVAVAIDVVRRRPPQGLRRALEHRASCPASLSTALSLRQVPLSLVLEQGRNAVTAVLGALNRDVPRSSAQEELQRCEQLLSDVPDDQRTIDQLDAYFTRLRNRNDLSPHEVTLANRLHDDIYRPLTNLASSEFRKTRFAEVLETRLASSAHRGTACLLMGLPGVGKSSAIDFFLNGDFSSQAVLFDDDEFKKAILASMYQPGSNGGCVADTAKAAIANHLVIIMEHAARWANTERPYTAEQLQRDLDKWLVRLVHPAVQKVAKDKLSECVAQSKNFILHHVFAHLPTLEAQLQQLAKNGYKEVRIIYVGAESDEAIRRGLMRAQKTGREVLSQYTTKLAKTYADVERGADFAQLEKRSVHPELNYFTLLTRRRERRGAVTGELTTATEFIYVYNGRGVPEGSPPLYIAQNSYRPSDVLHSQELRKADAAVALSAQRAAECRFRPAFHCAPKAGWMSDPNAPIYHRGMWHIFFQHAPYHHTEGASPGKRREKYWGHMVSTNLIDWDDAPIALGPSIPADKDGCFSGCAIDEEGVLTLFYSGNEFINRDLDDVDEKQCKATSLDGITFTKHPGNPVLGVAPSGFSGHFRDPYVFEYNERRYMLVSARRSKDENNGSILIYQQGATSNTWDFIGPLISSADMGLGAYMLECPSMSRINGQTVLFCSPQGVAKNGSNFQNANTSAYIMGDFDDKTGRLSHRCFGELDKGFDYYAALAFPDPIQHRTLLAGWLGMWGATDHGDGWAGMMATLREVSFAADGHLVTNPIRELEQCRTSEVALPPRSINNEELWLNAVSGDAIEIIAEFAFSACCEGEFGLKVRCSNDGQEETCITVNPRQSLVSIDRSKSGKDLAVIDPRGQDNVSDIRTGRLALCEKDKVRLRVLVDRSSVETFFDDGRLTMSARIYPAQASTGVKIFSRGGVVTMTSLKKWNLATDLSPK